MSEPTPFEQAEKKFHTSFIETDMGHKTKCWLWKSPDKYRGGYGRIWFSNTGVSAHRFSWLMHKGEIPKGIEVCHKCDIKHCVNPDHLFLGTHLENIRDAYSKNLVRPLNGVENGMHKLDDEKVRFIRKNYIRGKTTLMFFANMFKVDQSLIRRIIIGKSWSHVK